MLYIYHVIHTACHPFAMSSIHHYGPCHPFTMPSIHHVIQSFTLSSIHYVIHSPCHSFTNSSIDCVIKSPCHQSTINFVLKRIVARLLILQYLLLYQAWIKRITKTIFNKQKISLNNRMVQFLLRTGVAYNWNFFKYGWKPICQSLS